MDLKLKNIAWVGNISQKFETMCQEVDNIVCQDTVKYVGSQVQAMGDSVKKFYSDVVQDFVPPLVDPLKHEAQEVVLKGNASVSTYIKSMIGFEGNSVDTIDKQSHEELEAVDPIKNQVVDTSSQLDPVNQPSAPISVESNEGAVSSLLSGQVDDDLTYKNLDVGVEEKAIKEKSSTSEVTKLMSPGEKDSIEASFCEFGDYSNHDACGVVAEVSPATSVHLVDCQSTQKLDTVCDNFVAAASNSDTSSTLASSVMVSSVGCDSLCESSLENFPSETDCHNDPVEEAECVYDISDALSSSKSPIVTVQKDKAAALLHINSSSDLSLELIGEDESVSTTKFTGSQAEISPSSNVKYCGSGHLDTLTMTSPNVGSSQDHDDDLDYSGMETIELFSKVKLDDSCLMVDNSALYAVPYRIQKLRSFKKRIQDAFTSRKRLTKEYEQLAIWFGDVYMGSSQDPSQSHMSSTTSTSSTLDTNNVNSNEAFDSEWELL